MPIGVQSCPSLRITWPFHSDTTWRAPGDPQAARHPPRRPQESLRPAHPPPPRPDRLLRLGRARLGRAVVVVLRPRGGVPPARRAPAPGALPGGRDRRHGVPHLGLVQPDHRAVPERRRRLPGRHQAAGRRSRASISGCALVVDYVLTIAISVAAGVRRDLLVPARRECAGRRSCRRVRRGRLAAHRAQPARRQGIGAAC